jgi:MYXO-CTERM domain-containing protein
MKSLFLLFAFSAPAFAATSYILPGTSESGTWDLVATNYNSTTSPAYPSSGATGTAWGAPIAASSTSATFTRLSGIGYFIGSGSGIYGNAAVGSYGIADTAPMPNMANLIFQARLNQAPTSLVLNLNGGSQQLVANYALTTFVSNGSMGPIEDYAWQWDLSSYAGTITSYEIVMNVATHQLIYGNAPALTMISSSTSFAQVIPEPSAALLGLAGLAAFTGIRRRRA